LVTKPLDATRAVDAAGTRRLILRTDDAWSSVKVFTGPLIDGDNPIGEQVTEWLAAHAVQLVEVVIAQLVGNTGACISIGLFYRAPRQ
jgi:hypothetical protein